MQTKKFSWGEYRPLLALLAFFSICYFIVSCTSGSKNCTNPWATWDVTFTAGISSEQKTAQKNAFIDSITTYLSTPDANGVTCTITGYDWTDNTETRSQLAVCVSCKDINNNTLRTDTTAIRPPKGVNPPPSIISRLVAPGS